MLSGLLLSTALIVATPSNSFCGTQVVVSSPILRQSHEPLYLVGSYHYANQELIAEIRALRAQLASRGIGTHAPSALSLHCGKCHSGETAKGGFDLRDLSAEGKLLAIRMMATGEMPPNETLTSEVKNQILSELTATTEPVVTADPPPEPRPGPDPQKERL